VAAASGLAPSTFSRLARALGFESYEELRELSRDAIGRRAVTFSDKARRLRARDDADDAALNDVLNQQAAASIQNIEDTANAIPPEKLRQVAKTLAKARRVTLLGSLASRGVVDYMNYLAGWLSDRWSLANESGPSMAMAVADATPEDAFVLVSKPPFARLSMRAAQMAAEKGAFVLVITDTHTCPALEFASASFIVPTDSPHFFSSYVSTLLLIETLMSMIAAYLGADAENRIKEIEAQTTSLGQYWASE
jgi:DNA-binding MurR/RpiR family transcriptional regulator